MKTRTIGNITYRLVPEIARGSCKGCVAQHYSQAALCDQLRSDCVGANSIYVEDLPVRRLCAEPEPTFAKRKIVIKVEGGVVTYVCGNADVEVVVHDLDGWPGDAEPEGEVFDAACAGLRELPFQMSL